MAKKHISIVIIPHNRTSHRTISFSEKSLKWIKGGAVCFLIVMIGFFIDYFSMNGVRREFKELSLVSLQQRETISKYESSIGKLNQTIQNFENYARKLNVMAGLKSETVLEGEPGIGGPLNDQQVVPITPPPDANLERLQDINQKADSIEDNLNTLAHFFENQTMELAATPSIMPTRGYWVSHFGWRDDPFTGKRAFHDGVDIATQPGNPIVATADGLVIQTKFDRTGGKTVKISHQRSGYTTVYCHLSDYKVKPGQRVKRGDVIGLVGRTGRTQGPHVHYEVHFNGKAVNPYNYILDR